MLGGNIFGYATSFNETKKLLNFCYAKNIRASLFYDIGNVFNTGEVVFFDKLGDPVEYNTTFSDLKKSVGVAVQWLAPMGLFRFSYAYPLNHYEGSERFYRDEIERFQFSIGQSF